MRHIYDKINFLFHIPVVASSIVRMRGVQPGPAVRYRILVWSLEPGEQTTGASPGRSSVVIWQWKCSDWTWAGSGDAAVGCQGERGGVTGIVVVVAAVVVVDVTNYVITASINYCCL